MVFALVTTLMSGAVLTERSGASAEAVPGDRQGLKKIGAKHIHSTTSEKKQ